MAPERVLVATDGSEHSLRGCRRFVELVNGRPSEVRLLTVLSFELDPRSLLGEELPDAQERRLVMQRAVEERTSGCRLLLEAAGLPVAVTSRFGSPADEILAEIEEWQPSLVVVGRRGLSGPARLLLGSVSGRVVHHSESPVLVVP